MLVTVLGLLAVLLIPSPAPAAGMRGLWPLRRHDAQNTARCDVPGAFRAAPVEVWRYGSNRRAYGFVRPVKLGGKRAYLRQAGGGLDLVRPSGELVWAHYTAGIGTVVDVLSFPRDRGQGVLATAGNGGYTLLDLATGRTLWTWTPPPGALQGGYRFWKQASGGRLVAFPQNTTLGFCFQFDALRAAPRLLWRQDYHGKYWANFGPYCVIADMDNDRRPDVLLAGKPTYMAVIDMDTGAVKFDLQYPIDGESGAGRPYGLLQAVDVDGDGFRDAAMISCQVEEYAAVLHNEGGKRFRLAWDHFVEHDLPDDVYEVRPQVTSFADLAGNGHRALVLGLFNLGGDQRWHTVVIDPLVGLKRPLADLPDRYFWGCYDLTGDGRPEIVTSSERARRYGRVATIQVVDGRTYRDLASVDGVSLTLAAQPLPISMGYFAGRANPVYAGSPGGARGLLLTRTGGKAEELFRLVDGKARFDPLGITPLAREVLFSGESAVVREPRAAIAGRQEAPTTGAYGPIVCAAGGRRELVLSRTDLSLIGGVPDLARSGRFRSSWTARGSLPAAWMGPGGRRLVCAVDWQDPIAYVYEPGSTGRPAPIARIDLPAPPLRRPDMLLPFGRETMRLFVGLQTGVHTLASAVYDALGARVWYDAKEGPYPRGPAIFAGPDGRTTLVMDNHGKVMLYDERGGKRVVAHGWYDDVPGRGNGAKYALPIVGPFGPGGATRIVMSPGLERLEVLDADGARVAMSAYGSIYEREFCASSVGQIRGTGVWDVGMASHDGVFYSADAATARTRWSLDLGVRSEAPTHIVTLDVDGDGRDDYLVGLPNGDLVALTERAGKGVVLWRTRLDAGIRDVIAADLDGDGKAEIIVDTDDYVVRVMKPAGTRGARG
ncbi:MAG: VCBS repeat-containing protein [Chthonomonadales bacterium]|nr:VCBS repeat-containing protein [Chthonomonadales bacterium]